MRQLKFRSQVKKQNVIMKKRLSKGFYTSLTSIFFVPGTPSQTPVLNGLMVLRFTN